MNIVDVLANKAFLLIENSKIGVADAIEKVVEEKYQSYKNIVMTIVEVKIINKKRGLDNVPNTYNDICCGSSWRGKS